MSRELAIIGDRFMLASVFQAAIEERGAGALEFRSLDLPWPDEASRKTVRHAAGQIAEEVERYLKGQPPRNPC